ncbi:MAG: ATP synthase F1 subunit epsilon [Johnsonella sp.]|nr:ATP synthase F1 subunit epsilon [Johnsonella sp.]
MADRFRLKVITPTSDFYEGDVKMAEFTTTGGNIGVYPGHIPMTAVIAPGLLRIHEEEEIKEAALMSGFAEILQDKITILAEVCEWPDEIDQKRAEEAKLRAERRIAQNDEVDLLRAELALKRALIRLDIKKRY